MLNGLTDQSTNKYLEGVLEVFGTLFSFASTYALLLFDAVGH